MLKFGMKARLSLDSKHVKTEASLNTNKVDFHLRRKDAQALRVIEKEYEIDSLLFHL
jgi:Fe2+ transport system protein FeoA